MRHTVTPPSSLSLSLSLPLIRSTHAMLAALFLIRMLHPSIYLFLSLSLSFPTAAAALLSGQYPRSATKDMVNAIDREPLSLSSSSSHPASLSCILSTKLPPSLLPLPLAARILHALDRYSCMHARMASPSLRLVALVAVVAMAAVSVPLYAVE